MGSCSLGTSNIKVSNLDFSRARTRKVQPRYAINTCIGWRPLQHAGLVISRRSEKAVAVFCSSSSQTKLATETIELIPEETKSSHSTSQPIPNSSEVESLLTEICDTTSVAEFELKLGGFRLYVKRDLSGNTPPPPPPSPATVDVTTTAEIPDSNGLVTSTSLSIFKPTPFGVIQTFLDKAADEGIVLLRSPRVGFFRISRTIKGKRAPPCCKEKQIVKEAQVLCYIEQLGGEVPIESDVSGEVIKILREDGEPVGYGDALIAILPSFPGIKKLQ